MPVYPTSIAYEIYIDGAWEDITADVILEQSCSYGIDGNSEIDRVASTGQLDLILRNDSGCLGGVDGYYSPYNPFAKSLGWRTGIPLRLKLQYVVNSITDNFIGPVISPALWTVTEVNSTVGIDMGDSTLKFTAVESPLFGYATVTSINKYTLVNSCLWCDITEIFNTADNGATAWVRVQQDANNTLGFYFFMGKIYAQKRVAGVDTNITWVAYNAVTTKWIRIREFCGKIYWEYSADCITWTILASITNPFSVTELNIVLIGGTYEAEVAPGVFKISSLDLQPVTFIKFYGHISNIQPASGTFGSRRVKVTVLDWMDYAASHPIVLPTIVFTKRIDEVVPLIVASMPVDIRPLGTNYEAGQYTFPTIFDTVRPNTKAMSEFNKLALSELGYIYVKRNTWDGETLWVEGKNYRNTGSTSIGTFNDNMRNLTVSYGTNLANDVHVKSYPREVDAAATTVLFTLQKPLSLLIGETKVIRGSYRDPTGAAKVSGKDMQAPVMYPGAGYTYRMSVNADDTGGDLSGDLDITPTYGAEGVEYILENTGASNGYVTTLLAIGRGIYIYDPVEAVASDPASILNYGYKSESIDMKYQDDAYLAASVAIIYLNRDKAPREIAESVDFLANTDSTLMQAFLAADIGDMIYISETQTGISGYFYIQKIEFTILQGLVIYFTWFLKEALSMTELYWTLEDAVYGLLEDTTVLGY